MEPTLENEDATNLVDVENDAVLDSAEVADDQISDDDLDTSEEAGDGQPEDDTEEIDYEGKKYKLPKELKDAVLRQADYTRKTQEIAETRKALESRASEIAQQAEIASVTAEQRVNLKLIDQQLQTFSGMNWQQYAAEYGSDAVAASMAQWQQLRDARSEIEGTITKAEAELRATSERTTANAIAQADAMLSKEVEGWSPQLVSTLATYARTELGVTEQELRDSLVNPDGTPDTRTFKVLARLHKAETELAALKSTQSKAAQASKLASVQPAKTVGGKTNGYKPGLDDSLPAEEWMRRRNAQAAKAAGR